MNRALRKWLVWLLVLALPAHGALAATMALCGLQGPASSRAVLDIGAEISSTSEHCHPRAVPGHAVAEVRGLGQAGEASVSAEATVPDPATYPAQTDQHNCSVCTACSSAAALSIDAPMIGDPIAGRTEFRCVVVSVAPFVASGPDRPPRPLLV